MEQPDKNVKKNLEREIPAGLIGVLERPYIVVN